MSIESRVAYFIEQAGPSDFRHHETSKKYHTMMANNMALKHQRKHKTDHKSYSAIAAHMKQHDPSAFNEYLHHRDQAAHHRTAMEKLLKSPDRTKPMKHAG